MSPDWSTVAVLAAIVLAEGARRVPRGAVVLRALGLGEWLAVDTSNWRHGWRLVSWWPPLTRHVMIAPPGDAAATAQADLAERYQRVQSIVGWLEGLGALQLLALVAGVPLLSARLGGAGFLAMLAAVLLLSLTLMLLARHAMQGVGFTSQKATRATLGLLSPFASSRAAEMVLEAALRGGTPVQAARVMMTEAAFHEWIRPTLYDQPGERSTLLAQVDASDADSVARYLSVDAMQGPVCPRCGREYRRGVERCIECPGVHLSAPPAAAGTTVGRDARDPSLGAGHDDAA